MIYKIVAKLKAIFLYPAQFGEFGKGSRIDKPLKIDGKNNIFVGRNTLIQKYAWLGSLPLTGHQSQLKIGNDVMLGNFNHIYSTGSIVIEDKVLTADRVYISDNVHEYADISKPIIEQPIRQLKEVIIGRGAWIGENVCILGASVGKNSVIGSNSVVTKDIPDYCVAVGSPAKIIKRYSIDEKRWVRTDENGNFINNK